MGFDGGNATGQLRAVAENARALALQSRQRGSGRMMLKSLDVLALADAVLDLTVEPAKTDHLCVYPQHLVFYGRCPDCLQVRWSTEREPSDGGHYEAADARALHCRCSFPGIVVPPL